MQSAAAYFISSVKIEKAKEAEQDKSPVFFLVRYSEISNH